MNRFVQSLLVATLCFVIHALILSRLPAIQLVKYSHAAEMFLSGTLSNERVLDFSPLYLGLHIAIQKLDWPTSIVFWIHLVCGAVSATLLFQLLHRYFGGILSIAGTIIFVLDRSYLGYLNTFEPEALVALFILGVTYCVSMKSSGSALLGGILFGLGILTRPNFLPILLAVPFYYRYNVSGKQWRKLSALFAIPAVLCLGGLWIRNTVTAGYFLPFVMNPGTAFYEGNNPNSWGMSSVYPPVLSRVATEHFSRQPDYHHQLYRDLARKSTVKALTLQEVNAYWSRKAIRFLKDHPMRSFRLLSVKTLHAFHQYQWHDLAVAYQAEVALRQIWPYSFPFAILSSLAVLGLVVLISDWKRYLIFYAVFFSQILFMLSIYVSARQRISILFLFVFFACGTVHYVWKARKRFILLIPVSLLAILFSVNTDRMREEDHLWKNISASNRHLAESYRLRNASKWTEAAEHSAIALALSPWLYESRRPANLRFGERGYFGSALEFSRGGSPSEELDHALLLLENGNCKNAEIILRDLQEKDFRFKRDHYQSSEPLFYLGLCALKEGRTQEAVTVLQKAIQNSPGDPLSLAFLKALTGRPEYEQQLLKYFDEMDVSFWLGQAHLETDKPDVAVRYFENVVQSLPEFRNGYVYLAASLGKAGHYHEAAMTYRKAIAMNPDPVFLEEHILSIFQHLTHKKPNTINHYSYGVVLRQFGHFQQALEEQRTAFRLDPAKSEIQSEIRNLEKVLEDSSVVISR
jgi:tetratricopeptide (TPR) repeat protein